MVGGKLACDVPPEGWYCTRERGHAGPCAALPLFQEFPAAPPAEGHPTPPSNKTVPAIDPELPTNGWELVEHLLRERRTLLANTASAQNRGTECINKLRAGRALVRTYVVASREAERLAGPDPDGEWCTDAFKAATTAANEAFLALEGWLAENP